MDHAVGFEIDGELEIFVGGGESFEIVGAVPGSGAIHFGAVVGQFLLDVLAGLGFLEQQVLEQVRHAGFAGAFVARAHHVSDVDGDFGLGGIGEEQHMKAVGQRVLGDAFDGSDFLDALRQGLGENASSARRHHQAKTRQQYRAAPEAIRQRTHDDLRAGDAHHVERHGHLRDRDVAAERGGEHRQCRHQ